MHNWNRWMQTKPEFMHACDISYLHHFMMILRFLSSLTLYHNIIVIIPVVEWNNDSESKRKKIM